MERRELSAADIYCKFAAQLDEDGFRLYHAAQQITGFQPYDAFPYEDIPMSRNTTYFCFHYGSSHCGSSLERPDMGNIAYNAICSL